MLGFLKKKAKKTSSGEHPAVVDYKKTLESIKAEQCPEVDRLNREIKQYLSDVTTPVPPARTSDPMFDKEVETLPGI